MKTLLILAAAAMVFWTIALGVLIFILWNYPIGSRSAQDDIKFANDYEAIQDGNNQIIPDKIVVDISRPHFIIPREYIQRLSNPWQIWKYDPDPFFRANLIAPSYFVDLDKSNRLANVQGFDINPNFTNPDYREQVMAIKINGHDIYEFPTPGFIYWHGNCVYRSLRRQHSGGV
ncbi:MAG TPA: hypothetical protein DD729_00525 [Rhodobacteraceae bacterium]|nr:hypothetical protein [Paracoccaceae bacterium]